MIHEEILSIGLEPTARSMLDPAPLFQREKARSQLMAWSSAWVPSIRDTIPEAYDT
jgi:hypothetical protein